MVLVPSLGISLFNTDALELVKMIERFSSPLWGFLYLIETKDLLGEVVTIVLVPSLGISLFN